MHLHPIDSETREVLERHKMILKQNIDDFVSYINLTEKARCQDIKNKIRQEKLNDFVNADDSEKEDLKLHSRSKSSRRSRGRLHGSKTSLKDDGTKSACSDESWTPSEKEAMTLADEDKIFNLKDGCKTAKSHNMNPERFTCKLSTMAGKQHDTKRLYL